MPYYANLENDLPAPYKRKRAIFYRQGLKVYGLLPYILARRLKAQFFSNRFSFLGGTLSVGSLESNWTAVPYTQTPEMLTALLDWLLSDSGFEVAIASREDFDDDIFSSNIGRYPPQTWYPAGQKSRNGFLRIHAGVDRQVLVGLFSIREEAQNGDRSAT